MTTTMYTIESHDVTRDGVTVTVNIVPDDDPMSPRDWDNLGVMFCHHRNYDLGDERLDPGQYEDLDDMLSSLRETYDPTVILPLYLLDHSGVAMRAGADVAGTERPFVGDSQGWDTSFVGWIMDTAGARERLGIPDSTTSEEIQTHLLSEVEDYSTYLEGDVVGYVVEDEGGETLESCYGFFSIADAREQGLDDAEHVLDKLVPQRRVEAAYRHLARTKQGYAIETVDEDAPVETVAGGALVTAMVFVPSYEMAAILDQAPAT